MAAFFLCAQIGRSLLLQAVQPPCGSTVLHSRVRTGRCFEAVVRESREQEFLVWLAARTCVDDPADNTLPVPEFLYNDTIMYNA
jgi:hypothetical protein